MKKTTPWSLAAVATFAAAVAWFCCERPVPTTDLAPATNAAGTEMLGRLPVAFVPNRGQWEHRAAYVARFGGMTVFLEEKGWTFTLVEQTAPLAKEKSIAPARENVSARGAAVRMTFQGSLEPELIAEDRLPGRHNYFLGERSRWRTEVPLFGAVRYREMHAGIDVRVREHGGHCEYDLLLQPGAELEPVEVAVEGIERMFVDKDGALVLETALGPVRMPAPTSWEVGPAGEQSQVNCSYVLRGEDRFGFQVTGRRHGWALVVDPGLVWSTYLGASNGDSPTDVALNAQGAVTVVGWTGSTGFPTTPGAFDTSFGGIYDAFVTCLSPSGSSLVYSAFLGGADNEGLFAVALDAQGAATVAGITWSFDFPTTPGAFDTTFNGGADGYVTRLSPTGSSLVFSTFLGGWSSDATRGIAVDAQGATTCAGYTYSSDFPTTPGAFDTTFNTTVNPTSDGFVARLSPLGTSLVFSTFLGGTNDDEVGPVALDGQGTITVAGFTWSGDFPTTSGAFDTSHGTRDDGFVTRLSPMGTSLVYSTFLGGNWEDDVADIAVDAQGGVTATGTTGSTDFPTTPGAFDATFTGGRDAFVTRLSPSGASLVYSTYLGGAGWDHGMSLALDAQGAATVVGHTDFSDFPTTPGAYDRTNTPFGGVNEDAFVTRLSPLGSSLIYSTYLGNHGTRERAWGLALDVYGFATVVGETTAYFFPTTPGAFSTIFHGATDAFITRLDMLPTGATAFGNSSPGCAGVLPISVNSMPQVGNTNFALTCGNAPPNAAGLILFTGSAFASPLVVIGLEVWVDPSLLSVSGSTNSNSIGASNAPVPIPNAPALAGVRLFTQFAWAGPNAPLPCPPLGFSASNALDFTIQP